MLILPYLCLGLPLDLPVKIYKALLPSFIRAKCPLSESSRINHPDYIRRKVQTVMLSFCTIHFHQFWKQILGLGSYFQILLACVAPLM